MKRKDAFEVAEKISLGCIVAILGSLAELSSQGRPFGSGLLGK